MVGFVFAIVVVVGASVVVVMVVAEVPPVVVGAFVDVLVATVVISTVVLKDDRLLVEVVTLLVDCDVVIWRLCGDTVFNPHSGDSVSVKQMLELHTMKYL